MQVIIVLHDKEDDEGKKDKIEYSIFEKYNDGEHPEDMMNSPAVQVGSILSGFLKTIEQHGKIFIDTVINEENNQRYSKNDFRYHIKKYDNVIEIDLKSWKPKGKKN